MSNLYNKNLWFLALQELNINIKGIKRGESIYDNILWIDEENKPDESVILSKIEEDALPVLKDLKSFFTDSKAPFILFFIFSISNSSFIVIFHF